MCVIINVPANIVIPKYILKNCYDNNPHGWGIMFPKDGKLETIKDVSGYDKFLEAYDAIPDTVPKAVHFRIKTHGLIDQENCHPFRILDKQADHAMDLGLMHNGVISTALYDDKKSDTWNFSFHVLQPILEQNQHLLDNSGFRQMLEDVAGGSRLLFMNENGDTLTINEELGHKAHGAWFSNSHSLLTKYIAPAKPYSGRYVYSDGAVQRQAWLRDEYDFDQSGYDPYPRRTIPAVCSTGGAAAVTPSAVREVAPEETAEDELPENVKAVQKISEKLFITGDAQITWDVLETALRAMSLTELEQWIEEDTELAAMTISALIN